METDYKKIILNTLFWGFILWLFGYILGIIFFATVPKDQIGWYILPFGVAFTLWVLFRKIERESWGCYFGLGVFWTVMAVALDYIFIVKMLNSAGYYKLDIYGYYALTFLLPVVVGRYKHRSQKNA